MKIIALTIALLLSGCVTPKVIQQPAQKIDFSAFKTVSYSVRPSEYAQYGAGEEAITYAKETIANLDALLGSRLKLMGYQVVDVGSTADLAIQVEVTAAKPGDAATRFFVGFGAGRAVTTFTASFKTPDGKTIGSFEGGRSYTGMELNTDPFAKGDNISLMAATRSVEQIRDFMLNGGALKQ